MYLNSWKGSHNFYCNSIVRVRSFLLYLLMENKVKSNILICYQFVPVVCPLFVDFLHIFICPSLLLMFDLILALLTALAG